MDTRKVATEYRMMQWAQAIKEHKSNGETINEFCQKANVSRNTYFYWQKKLREAACTEIVKASSNKNNPVPTGFAEVMVYEPPRQQPPARAAHNVQSPTAEMASQIRIEVSGIQISADSTYPTDKIAALIRELKKS